MVGHSTDGTAEVAAQSGARVMPDAGRGRERRSGVRSRTIRTPVTVFLDADGSHDPEDIPLLVEPILADRRRPRVASRLRGGSSELHGGFDEFFRLTGSSFITACINWRFDCRLSESQNGFRAIRTSVLRQLDLRENIDDDRAGDDHQDPAAGLADGRGAKPRASPRARRLSYPRVARRSAVRLFARQVSVLLTGSCPAGDALNILGIWDGHDSGAALLQDGRLRFAVNEERLTRRKLEVRFPDAVD